MAPKIMGCIDDRLKTILVDAVNVLCSNEPTHPLCDPEFGQELRALPRCDVYKAPKQTRRLSDYQKHLSVCMKDTAFSECVRKWKENEKMDHLYQGSGYTGP